MMQTFWAASNATCVRITARNIVCSRAMPPESALQLLNQLKLRSDNVALLLTDQRMPKTDDVRFLQQARDVFPEAEFDTKHSFSSFFLTAT
jgi:DNA-binding NarL/FixJ family response regulator